MSSKKLTPSQLRKFRSDVAALKSKGLVSKNKDARKQAPTRYMLGQVEKFKPVLEGKATTVKVSSKDAKMYGEIYGRKGRTIVLPAAGAKGEKPRYNKKTGQITSTYFQNGQRVVREWPKTPLTDGISDLPKGGDVWYTIPFQSRGAYRTNDLADLYSRLRDLVSSGWANVQQYVIVERLQPGGGRKLTGL